MLCLLGKSYDPTDLNSANKIASISNVSLELKKCRALLAIILDNDMHVTVT